MMRTPDTMHLHYFYASAVLVEVARERDDLRVVEEPTPLTFDDGAFATPSMLE